MLEHDGLSFAAIVEMIGMELAARLSMECGGKRLYLPRRPVAGSPLVEAIGEEAAGVLCRQFGGEHIDIGSALGKRAAIHAMLRMEPRPSIGAVAHKFRVSRRTVIRISQEEDPLGNATGRPVDTRQMDLFAEPGCQPAP